MPTLTIGLVEINEEEKRITLHPGVYRLTKPVVFGLLDETVISEAVIDGEHGASHESV